MEIGVGILLVGDRGFRYELVFAELFGADRIHLHVLFMRRYFRRGSIKTHPKYIDVNRAKELNP